MILIEVKSQTPQSIQYNLLRAQIVLVERPVALAPEYTYDGVTISSPLPEVPLGRLTGYLNSAPVQMRLGQVRSAWLRFQDGSSGFLEEGLITWTMLLAGIDNLK